MISSRKINPYHYQWGNEKGRDLSMNNSVNHALYLCGEKGKAAADYIRNSARAPYQQFEEERKRLSAQLQEERRRNK